MQCSIRSGYARPKSLILAVAAHVEDGAPRPPELDWYLFREWGPPHAGGWQEWPAREFVLARAARNVYLAMSGYKNARDIVAWTNDNPQGWELVSSVLSMRMAAQHA